MTSSWISLLTRWRLIRFGIRVQIVILILAAGADIALAVVRRRRRRLHRFRLFSIRRVRFRLNFTLERRLAERALCRVVGELIERATAAAAVVFQLRRAYRLENTLVRIVGRRAGGPLVAGVRAGR